MTLSDVQRERYMLACHLRVVRQQLRAGGTAKSIQRLGAGALNKVPNFKRPHPGLSRLVLRISVDLLSRPIQIGVQRPA